MWVATVLYEDKMQVGSAGAFPPHDFVLAMVADATGQKVWQVSSRIYKNPRNGVSKLIRDIGATDRIAGRGRLCVVVDRDRVAEHVGLPKNAPDSVVVDRLKARSDAPHKLSIHFLYPNIEGVMESIESCDPEAAKHPAPAAKDHNSRDIYLNRAAFSLPPSVRDCVRGKQPGLAGLVALLAELVA